MAAAGAKTNSLQLNVGGSMYNSSTGDGQVDTQRTQKPQQKSSVRDPPKPSAHVGVLKVPDSLKAQHMMADDPLEQVATGKARKGAGK